MTGTRERKREMGDAAGSVECRERLKARVCLREFALRIIVEKRETSNRRGLTQPDGDRSAREFTRARVNTTRRQKLQATALSHYDLSAEYLSTDRLTMSMKRSQP